MSTFLIRLAYFYKWQPKTNPVINKSRLFNSYEIVS